jgi:hypothetical protein
MLKSPIQSFSAAADETITLLNGQKVPLIYVSFVPSTYQFFYTQGGQKIDVTYQMTQKQKLLFPNFDPTEWNERLYHMKATGENKYAPLETSTAKLFKQNVVADIKQKTTLGVGSLGATLGLVLGGYIVFKMVTK